MTQTLKPTAYGYMLDHLWATPNGENTARRRLWVRDLFISIRPCSDDEPLTELSEGATHWLFFTEDSGTWANREYDPIDDDLTAYDWELYEGSP